MEKNLILLARFSQEQVKNELIPEIERSCTQHGMISQAAYDIYQANQLVENSLYFCHSYASYDIPIGEEYEAVALVDEDWKILPDSIQKCHSRILCFFTAVWVRPSDIAMRGHHEISQIQFEGGIPSIIYEGLVEITKKSQGLEYKKQIILCSESELQRLSRKPGKYFEGEY